MRFAVSSTICSSNIRRWRVFPIIGRRDVSDAVGMRGKLITFLKTDALRIVGIVNRNRLSSVFLHHGKARDIGGPIANVNHVRKRNRPNFRVHVVVHVLRHIEKPFVNAEETLRLLGVTNDALGKGDAAFGISGEFAAENGASRLPSINTFNPDEIM
jgi:hypothetical protein